MATENAINLLEMTELPSLDARSLRPRRVDEVFSWLRMLVIPRPNLSDAAPMDLYHAVSAYERSHGHYRQVREIYLQDKDSYAKTPAMEKQCLERLNVACLATRDAERDFQAVHELLSRLPGRYKPLGESILSGLGPLDRDKFLRARSALKESYQAVQQVHSREPALSLDNRRILTQAQMNALVQSFAVEAESVRPLKRSDARSAPTDSSSQAEVTEARMSPDTSFSLPPPPRRRPQGRRVGSCDGNDARPLQYTRSSGEFEKKPAGPLAATQGESTGTIKRGLR
jgi:hypothetical protein